MTDDSDRHIEALVGLSHRIVMLAEVYHAEAVVHHQRAELCLGKIGNVAEHAGAVAQYEMAKRHCDDLLALVKDYSRLITSE